MDMKQGNETRYRACLAAIVCLQLAVAGSLGAAEKIDARASTHYDLKKAPWPCWRGPYSNGSAPEQGIQLIDDLSQAKLVWVSEDTIPGAYMSHGGVAYWTGGHSSPIVAEGRVYIAYSCPPERTTYAFTKEDLKYRTKTNRQPYLPDKTGDDVIHCFDANTGKTLWRRVFSKKGITGLGEGWHLTACYADGRIYAPGSAGALYCVDAATGEPLWQARVEGHPLAQKGKRGARCSTMCGTPQVADGVVILGHGPLHGFDAATGQKRWVGPSVPRGHSPVVWRHKGQDYFVVGNEKGAMLITPRDGKVQWTAPPGKGKMHCGAAFAVSDNYLVVLGWGGAGVGAGGRVFAGGPTCYRISPTGYEQVWSCPISIRGGALFAAPTIHRGRVYVDLIRAPSDPPGRRKSCMACLDLATGAVLATGNREDRVGVGLRSIAAEGRILAHSIHHLGMVDAQPDAFRLLSTNKGMRHKKATSTTVGYAAGLIYMRTEQGSIGYFKSGTFPNPAESRLVCYDLRAE
jgi:outer membrane protein assembly factor BamB